jgi:alanyl-tRNA synthetase
MTDRLYYRDAYRVRFSGCVVDVADEGKRLYLDRSAFYPTSGGQPHDLGRLDGTAVLDVVDEGDRVAHLLASPLTVAPGATVEGVIDWPRRWDHMQQHTGQHLLSAIAADGFGWETVSVHFGAEASTLDLATADGAPANVTANALRELERRANAAASENRTVRVLFEDAALAAGLRKPSDRSGELRIVEIDGLDRSACGGTHVRATGEIGAITLRRVEKVRKATRVEFLCGARAIARARADYDSLAGMAQGLSCSVDELPALVPALADQLKASDAERRKLEGEVAASRARARHEALPEGSDGLRRLVERRPAGKADDVRAFALAFAGLPRAVYASVVQDPPSILLATSEDSTIDAGKALKEALSAVGGRGGGGPRLAQGTVPDAALLESLLHSLGFAPDIPT